MGGFKGKERWEKMAAVLLSVLIIGGCSSIKYAYDMKTNFSDQKSYAWAPLPLYQPNHLLEKNVQDLADPILARKGFTKAAEGADLLMALDYESEGYNRQSGYRIQMLTLNIYETGNSELVWRGTAFGSIDTDAASDDLKDAVQRILANFPPK